MYNKLIAFITKELDDRGWSHRELARRAGVSQSAVSATLAAQRKPGADFCVKIAKGFSEPPEKLLRLAGVLPLINTENDPIIKDILDLLNNMPHDTRSEALNYIRYLYQLQEE